MTPQMTNRIVCVLQEIGTFSIRQPVEVTAFASWSGVPTRTHVAPVL